MTGDDLERVVPAQARAFFDDPLQTWALPEPSTRLALLEQVFALQLRVVSIPLGASYTDPTGAVGAFWAPPDRWQIPPAVAARLAPLADVLGARIGAFRSAMDAMHACHPRERHWYLAGLGTDPAHQGRGLAAAALAPVLGRCDREGWPAYLESTKVANVGFYERFGFRATGEIVLPDGGPTLVPMWRDPA